MIPKYKDFIQSISGSMDENHYGSVNPANPDKPIIKHKPRHKPGWQKPPSMIAQNSTYQQAIATAQREYRDPVTRAVWQAEYDEWRRNQSRHGHTVPRPGEPRIRFLWDYIRWQCLLRAYNAPATPIVIAKQPCLETLGSVFQGVNTARGQAFMLAEAQIADDLR